MNYVEKNCAPAVYTPELRYVCIAGRYLPFRLGFQDLLYCLHIDLVIELCCGLWFVVCVTIYFAEDAKLLKRTQYDVLKCVCCQGPTSPKKELLSSS